MGTAFGVCFGYWIGGSALFYSVSFMCNTHLTFLQILSLSVSMSKAIKIQSICPFVWPKSSLPLHFYCLPCRVFVYLCTFSCHIFLTWIFSLQAQLKLFRQSDLNFGI